MTPKTSTPVADAGDAIAATKAAARAWFSEAIEKARGSFDIDSSENTASQAIDAANKLRAVLLKFGIVSADGAPAGVSAAEAIDSAVVAVKAKHKERQTHVSGTQSYGNAADYLDAGRAFAYLRAKLNAIGVAGGTERL